MLPHAPLMAASGCGSSSLRASHDASLAAHSADHPSNTVAPLTALSPVHSEFTAFQPPAPTVVALVEAVASQAWLVQLAMLSGVQSAMLGSDQTATLGALQTVSLGLVHTATLFRLQL